MRTRVEPLHARHRALLSDRARSFVPARQYGFLSRACPLSYALSSGESPDAPIERSRKQSPQNAPALRSLNARSGAQSNETTVRTPTADMALAGTVGSHLPASQMSPTRRTLDGTRVYQASWLRGVTVD